MLLKELFVLSLTLVALHAQEHYGTCPDIKQGQVFGECSISCDTDRKCGDDEKCCFNGCGMSCLKSCAQVACKCPFGTVFFEENGCHKCSCKENPCFAVKCSANHECQVNKDTLNAECVPTKECPLYKCIPCPDGYVRKTDSDGCLTCSCVQAPISLNQCVDDISSCKCETGAPFLIPVDGNCKRCSCENLCKYTRCYSGHSCVISAGPDGQPQAECIQNRCKSGVELPNVFCGRGPSRQECPNDYYCEIAPTDAYAVCCPQ